MATPTGKFNGTDLILYFGGIAVAHSNTCVLEITQNQVPSTDKDSNRWDQFINGQRGFNISVDGLINYSTSINAPELFDDYIATDASATARFSTAASGDLYWEGSVNVGGLTLTGNLDETASYAGTLQGTGQLTRADS